MWVEVLQNRQLIQRSRKKTINQIFMKPINNSEYDESCPIIAFDYLNESWNLINLFFELLFNMTLKDACGKLNYFQQVYYILKRPNVLDSFTNCIFQFLTSSNSSHNFCLNNSYFSTKFCIAVRQGVRQVLRTVLNFHQFYCEFQ